jgi:hypothetical protein
MDISGVANNKAYVGLGHGGTMYDYWKDFYEYTPPAMTTSIPTNKLDNEIAVFPNPNSSVFTVKFNAITKDMVIIRVYNALGQCIYFKEYKEFSGELQDIIDLSKHEKGIYNLEIILAGERNCKKIIAN